MIPARSVVAVAALLALGGSCTPRGDERAVDVPSDAELYEQAEQDITPGNAEEELELLRGEIERGAEPPPAHPTPRPTKGTST